MGTRSRMRGCTERSEDRKVERALSEKLFLLFAASALEGDDLGARGGVHMVCWAMPGALQEEDRARIFSYLKAELQAVALNGMSAFDSVK